MFLFVLNCFSLLKHGDERGKTLRWLGMLMPLHLRQLALFETHFTGTSRRVSGHDGPDQISVNFHETSRTIFIYRVSRAQTLYPCWIFSVIASELVFKKIEGNANHNLQGIAPGYAHICPTIYLSMPKPPEQNGEPILSSDCLLLPYFQARCENYIPDVKQEKHCDPPDRSRKETKKLSSTWRISAELICYIQDYLAV